VMYMTPGLRVSVYLIPVWLLVLCIGYAIRQRRVGVAARP
jgi:aromatic amino acid transport protein AroP